MTNLIIDVSNIAWATRFAEFKKQNQDEFSKDLLLHSILASLIQNSIKFNAGGILLAFDGRRGWRKGIYPAYKGNREKDLYFEEVIEVIDTLRTFFAEKTDVTTVTVDEAEADDVIRTATIMSPKSIIISSDKDFIQLINAHTRLYASTLDLERTSENPAYDLYVKCIRGDTGDNVMSAYPRVRETKLKAAWDDGLAMANLMETVLLDGRKVADNYEFNRKLIDLSRCPSEIQTKISNEITASATKTGCYSQAKVMQALGALKLNKLARETASTQGFYQKRFVLK